jgi:hypothetical protein
MATISVNYAIFSPLQATQSVTQDQGLLISGVGVGWCGSGHGGAFLLSERQMARISPFFPMSHGVSRDR